MHRYLILEIRRSVRDRRYMAIVVGWPVAAYLLFSTVFGNPRDRAQGLGAHTEIMVAMATFGAIGAVLLATGPRMAAERRSGWMRQLALTPARPAEVLAVRAVTGVLLALPAICLTFLAAATVKGVHLAAWQWPAMAALLLVGCVPFAALGMVVGTVADGDSATGLTMVIYISLAVLGGLWVPARLLPPAMQDIAHFLPSYRLADVGWHVAGGTWPPVAALGVLLAWAGGAAALALALRRRMAALAR